MSHSYNHCIIIISRFFHQSETVFFLNFITVCVWINHIYIAPEVPEFINNINNF